MNALLFSYGTLFLILFIAFNLSTSFFTAWLAEIKGYSAGAWFLLGLLFGLVALISIGLSPNKRSEKDTSGIENIEQNIQIIAQHYQKIEEGERFEVDKMEEAKKVDENKARFKSYEEILNDPEIRTTAEQLGRVHGEDVKEEFLKEKMKEFGLSSKS